MALVTENAENLKREHTRCAIANHDDARGKCSPKADAAAPGNTLRCDPATDEPCFSETAKPPQPAERGMETGSDEQIEDDNFRILALLSRYLTDTPTFINAEMMEELLACGVDSETAFSLLLAAAMGLDTEGDARDRALYRAYFPRMVQNMRYADYVKNPYYRSVRLRPADVGACALGHESYAPYEAFVCDDMVTLPDGRRIPQIGYFDRTFSYPAIWEDGRLWMSVTPNEVNTMAAPIAEASGRVLAFGLGLGYFPYMASLKPDVTGVTVVEQNPEVIALFTSCILPQFAHRDKVTIVQGDAFAFAAVAYPKGEFDYAFTDLWHDVSDGLPLYRRMRALAEKAPAMRHAYWIEKTLRCYMQE